MDEYMRVLEFVKPDPIGASFDTNPETLSFSWSGADGLSRASAIAEEVAEHFTEIIFHICWHCIDTDDFTFGMAENGVIKQLEMSREMRETINEMLHYGVDVDPYVGPTKDNYHQLQLCRWDDAMENIKDGGNLLKTASLQIMDLEEFSRVLNYVKPDETETAPQDRDEYVQVTDYVATLSGAERCAWMTRHCARLFLSFSKNEEKLQLLWSGPEVFEPMVLHDIARLVVAQFPDIKFRICVNYYEASFARSENGDFKWLELSRDEQQRMLDEVRDSILEDNSVDLPF